MKKHLLVKWDRYVPKIKQLTTIAVAIGIVSATVFTKVQAQCLTNLSLSNTNIGMFNGSTSCLIGDAICLSSTDSSELVNALDGNYNTYMEWTNLVSVLGGSQGVTFQAKDGNNYNHKMIAILFSTGGSAIDLSLLSGLSISLYNDSLEVGNYSYSSLLSSGGVLNSGSNTIVYVPAASGMAYDEIRISKTSGLISALDNVRIHDIMLIDTTCDADAIENCLDFIQGMSTVVTSSSSLLNILSNVSDINYINNASTKDYASLGFTVSALSTYAIGVADLKHIYNKSGSYTAGVVIASNDDNFLDITALSGYNLKLVTYLYGVPQDSSDVLDDGVGSSLLSLSAMSAPINDPSANKQNLSFETDKPFNEIRLQFTTGVGVSLAPAFKIYGFYESPTTCGECMVYIKSGSGEIQGTIRTGTEWTSNNSTILTPGINNKNNVLDADETNYASMGGLLSAFSTLRMTVELDSTLASGTFAALEVGDGTGLLNLSLLNNLTLKTYKGTTLQQTMNASELAALNLLSSTTDKSMIGFTATKPFDAVMLESYTTLGLFSNFRIYNFGVITDADKDGVPDCYDNEEGCNNTIDANNNGIPDDCDAADIVSTIELNTPATSFQPGDTIPYKITIENVGNAAAENVDLTYLAPATATILDWVQVTTCGSSVDTVLGSGTVNNEIPYLAAGCKMEYFVNVVMSPVALVPFAQSSIYVTPPTSDPTPECDDCISAPLPRQNYTDLKLAIATTSTKVNNVGFLDFDVIVAELNNEPTEGQLQILIPKNPSYYTVEINTARTIPISLPTGVTDLGNWTLDNTHPLYYVLKSNTGYNVGGLATKYIPLKITKVGTLTNYELKKIQLSISTLFDGGDKNATNNTTDLYLLFNVL